MKKSTNTPAQNPVTPKSETPQWKNVEYPTVYSNIMGFGMTPFDVNIIFGEVDAVVTEGKIAGIPRVKVILTPEQTANLFKMLGAALQSYVKNNGALRQSGAIDLDELNEQIDAAKMKSNAIQ